MTHKKMVEIESEELESLRSLVKSMSFYLAGLGPRLETEQKFSDDIKHMVDKGLNIIEHHLKKESGDESSSSTMAG